MRLFKWLVDQVRTWIGVRKVRQLTEATDRPTVGTSIVNDPLRLRLKYPIDDALWSWFVSKGWRAMPTRRNRRRYIVVPEKTLIKLMKADLAGREAIHDKLPWAGRPVSAR